MAFVTRKEYNELARRLEVVELKLANMIDDKFEPETSDSIPDIDDAIEGEPEFLIVDQKITDLLVGAGYTSMPLVVAASDEALLDVSKIGPKVLEKIRAATAEE